jgi:hypothetical protein
MAIEAAPEAAESGAAGSGGSRAYTPRHAATQPRGIPSNPGARAGRRPAVRGQAQLAPRKNPAQKRGQAQLAPKRASSGNPARQGQGGKSLPQRAQGQAQTQARKLPRRLSRTAYHRIVIAEFLATVVIICAAPLLVPRSAGSGTPGEEAAAAVRTIALSRPLVRLTAACVVFFILALLAGGERTGRVAAALGGLVALGALLNATDALAALGQMFTGAQAGAAGADKGVGAAVDADAASGGQAAQT